MRRLVIAFFVALAGLVPFVAPAHAAAPHAAPLTHVSRFTQYTATATVSRPAPIMNQKQTITATLKQGGVPVVGATMKTTWKYKTTASTCIGTTNAAGVATCSRAISHATPGYRVRVLITFTKAGKVLATTETGFTPAR